MRDCEACISQSSCWPARLGVGFRANHPTLSTPLLTSEIPSLQRVLRAPCYNETLHVKEEFKISLFYKPTSARHQVIAVRLVCPLFDDTFLRTPNRTQFHLCLFQPSITQKHSFKLWNLTIYFPKDSSLSSKQTHTFITFTSTINIGTNIHVLLITT